MDKVMITVEEYQYLILCRNLAEQVLRATDTFKNDKESVDEENV